eukprot:1929465-Pyramimonas_sp.AAC.1
MNVTAATSGDGNDGAATVTRQPPDRQTGPGDDGDEAATGRRCRLHGHQTGRQAQTTGGDGVSGDGVTATT